MKAGILIGHLKNKGNEAAIIRTAEAFGLCNVFVIGKKEKKYIAAEGTEKHVNFFEFKDIEEFLNYACANNHKLVCIENINEAEEISNIEKYPVNPIFITGHENLGIPDKLLQNTSLKIKIKQGIGYAKCLNTGIAMGIVLHDFFKKAINKNKLLWREREN